MSFVLLNFVLDDRFYDDSPPPNPAIRFSERFMTARHEEGCYESNIIIYILSCLQRTKYRTRWRRDGKKRGTAPHFIQETRPGDGFKIGDFVRGKLVGEATVVRTPA